MIVQDLFEAPQSCPECGGVSFSDLILAEKKDACYYKVKASAKVWPSAYASGRLVQCRKKGADNYGNSKNEGVAEARSPEEFVRQMDKIAATPQTFEVGDWVTIDPNETSGYASSGMIGRIIELYDDEGESMAKIAVGGGSGVQKKLGKGVRSSGTHTVVPTSILQKDDPRGVAEGYSLKKTSVNKYMEPGDPDEYEQDVNIKDTDYEIINNKTGQVVGTASWTTNDFFGPGALKITMRNGATRWLDIWEREKGNPQTAFNRFVKDPKTAKKYKEQGVAEGLSEMDKSQTPPGRDGDIDWTKKQIHLGPEHVIKAKDVAKHALKALDKSMKKSHADTPKKKGVAEAINPDITNPAFSHQQQIGDYLYVARYWSKGLKIAAYHGNKLIGRADLMYHSAPFDDFADPKTTPNRIWLESEITEVNPKYQRQGIMSTMYAYARMLGNTIKPSGLRSPDAKAAWASWRQSGDKEHLTKMKAEGVAEEHVEEINWKKAAATGALALGALGGLGASGSAQARVTPGADGQMSPSAAQQMSQQGFQASAEKPGGQMPNQNLDSAEKVERGDNGIIVHYGGKEYKGVLVPKDGPTPRGAKMIRIAQAQMGERGIGNYTTYLLPNGTAFIYKLAGQSANEGVAQGDNEKIGGQYDPDDFDAMVQRLKKLAGAGPMKTVYDPQRRVYRNMPVAQQPDKK